ncbi:glycoside hydrolase family 2 TIM barrel-domain containing protein [Nocardia goodfellowii]
MLDLTAMPYDDSGFHSVGRLPMHGIRRVAEIDLDGDWEFQLLETPGQRLGDQWRRVVVPELWTMREDSDRPHYTNVPMPFDEVPPQIPRRNPTGVYRREFDLADPGERRVVLHVGAAEGLLRAFVNGRPVGLSTDSHLAAEFDVTDACVPGANTVTLAVSKWSSVSYLEDQDQWWQSGISRSVFLYTVPVQRLADIVVHADFEPETARGALRVEIATAGLDQLSESTWSVQVEALGRTVTLPVAPRRSAPSLPLPTDDRSVRPQPRMPGDFMELLSLKAADAPIPERLAPFASRFGQALEPVSAAGTAELAWDDLAIAPWTAETPGLYALVVRLVAPDGTVTDEYRTRMGFRRVRIEGRDLLVNGERILIQGVNRHDVDPRTGRVFTRDALLADLALLKRCNFNAIRASHYPNDPEFLALCDEIGFYVVDEADIEGHAFAATICDDPGYLPAFTERLTRMVLRDRNHPSVIMWSLGNETGYGANHDALAGWLRRFDSTRPLHYEGAISHDWHAGHAVTDVVCPMYPGFDALRAYAQDPRADRPLILCEYAYSQGNSTGGLAEYWNLFETLPGLQGGFIWGFKDHALDPDGDGKYRYGGDFGDEPNSGPTLLYGLAFPDLTPKPALQEARGLFSPVRIVSDAAQAKAGTVTLRNRQTFADLSGFLIEVHLDTADGALGRTSFAVGEVPAGSEATVELPASIRVLLDAEPFALTVTVRTRAHAVWAPAGTIIAAEQIRFAGPSVSFPSAVGRADPLDADGQVRHPLLRRAPRLCLWRALTDVDRSIKMDQRFVRSGFFRLDIESAEVDRDGGTVIVDTLYRTAFGDQVRHHRTIRVVDDGDYVCTEHVWLPEGTRDGLRVGIELELVDGFTDARWVGLGPWENYPDRRTSALFGTWRSDIDELAVPYLRPQENGGRGDVSELILSGPAGTMVTSHPPLHATVSRYTIAQLEEAAHWWELPPSGATIVHLDVAHRGLGEILGGDTLPEFRLTEREYTWRWRLRLTSASAL